jgi:LacI family transcriptional regulator
MKGDVTSTGREVRATVRDIAAETGVSIATVSRVLNEQDNVAPHTRELVRRAAERLGARQRDPRGRGAVRMRSVYLRCPYVLTDYFGLIVSSIAETLALHGLQAVLDAGEASLRSDVLTTLPDRGGIDAAVMILPPESHDELIALAARRFPFVVVDPRTSPPPNVVTVSAANFAGARALTAHLTGLGHRRIGVIGGPREWMAGDARLAGHQAALADVGVLSTPELVRTEEPTVEYGYRAARELLALPDPPSAIVGFNDKVAVGALRAAQDLGRRVPGAVSIAGFDDIDVSRVAQPMLTTVRQPLAEMGRIAVTQLVRLLERHALDAVHVELATELVIRASTGPAPARRS